MSNLLKLGFGEGAGSNESPEIKAVVGAVEKALPDIVDKVVEMKVAQISEKAFSDIDDIKSELKKLNLIQKSSNEVVRKAFTETAMVSIIKKVWNENINTEQNFKSIVEAELKTMGEGTAGAGAELVFDQFEKDILKVINSYELLNSVKILNLVKGDKISLPKATNGITTTYVTEGGAPNLSDAVTGFVSIDIYKAVSIVDMTDELMNDSMTVPDLYELIVEFIGESQAEFLEKEILRGTGTNAIEGILVNSDVNVIQMSTAGERTGDIDDDHITQVLTKAPMKYKRKSSNIKWVMSQYTYGKLRQLKTTDGYPLYPELRDMSNPFLQGFKVSISDKMTIQSSAEDTAGAISLLFGDLGYYTLVRRRSLILERGFYGNNWKNGIQSLKGTSRQGGKCTFGEAFTVLKNANT